MAILGGNRLPVAEPQLTRRKRIAYSLIAFAVSVVLCFGTSEVILRLFAGWAFSVAADSPLEVSSVPGLKFQLRSNYVSDKVQTDEYGFRSRPADAKPAKRSILVLGDSIAFSSGLAYEKSFSSKLEKSFTEETGEPVAVWNGAAPGYNTDQEAAQFDLAGPRLRPAVTILEYCMNDYLDPPQLLTSGKLDATAPSGGGGFSALNLLFTSRTYVFGKEKIKDLQETWPEWFPNSLHYVHYLHHKPGWQRSKLALLRMKASADKLGSHFLLVVFPVEQQLRISERDALDDIVKFATDNQIDVLDLYPSLQARWKDGLYVGNWAEVGTVDTLHLNERGHEIVAEQINQAVLKRGWLNAPTLPGKPKGQPTP